MSFDRFLATILFTGIALLACLMPVQNDTWWHLRAGAEMIASGRVLLTDTFSHTVAGAGWPNYEWLGEVVFALVHRAGGMRLLTAVCAAAITGGLLLVFATMSGTILTRVLLMTAVVASATLTWSVRPQVFSQLLLGLTLWLLVQKRWHWLPLVFLVWANMHGAVAWGAVLLAGAFAGHLWHERGVPRRLVIAGALSAAVTLVTPLGTGYWWEILASVRRSRANDIAEWHAPHFLPDHPVFWAAAAVLPVLLLLRHRMLDSAERRGIAVSALLLLPLAATTMRNITPFMMVAAPAVSFLLRGRESPGRTRSTDEGRPLVHIVIVSATIGLAGYGIWSAWVARTHSTAWRPISAQAARAIEACRAPLYNRYADGGPIIFFAPTQKVLIDSRQDPYPAALFARQHEVEERGEYEGLFRQYGINCAALPPYSPTVRRLLEDGWIRRFEDAQWVVLERPRP